ncbi:hypothetical protein N7478_006444 [Penicillium angulare]|uniref:uncharacterized protein n=1 Tax=Penicillium angulare TaxID=116970 RepID=UPI0025421A29|nr:uncharacterized protein N7478_006444 [Penicillium angulare]KAJ5281072.1 hypothetical protein N7478_006444 [Penicillium angulare]
MSIPAPPQGPVEARSLSSVTAIASNPPAYPRNPTHEKLDPLVLYIVRVPGSQDIFLSPVKPPTKSSVSAEAINASLYYVHVATPEDETLLQEVEQERVEEAQRRREALEAAGLVDPAQRDFARMNNVRRKPVGGIETGKDNAQSLTQENAPPPLNNAPALPPRPTPMPRVSAENMSFSGTPVSNAIPGEPAPKSPITRRPLPPLPPSEEPFGAGGAGEDPRNSRWSTFTAQDQPIPGYDAVQERYGSLGAGRHSLDSPRPPLPPRPSHTGRGSPSRSPGQSPSGNRRSHQPPSRDPGFYITLIRRDPASGGQWNVATISSPGKDQNTIDIEISTPGYNRFAGSNEPLSLGSLAANLPPGLIRTAGTSIPSQPSGPIDQPNASRKFHREVCVSKPYDDQSASSELNPHDYNSKLKSGYYVFNSPWNGTCTFASSVNGRSLKCKHMVQGPAGGAFPPSNEADPNPAVTVAEIRFNTPFQAANLHYHALQRTNPHLSSHTSMTTDPSNPDSSSKRASLSQFLNPNNYARPRAHSGPNTSSPSPGPGQSPAQSSDPSRQPFNPSNLLRRTSLRAGKFAHQQTNRFGHQHFHRRNRSTSTSSGGSDFGEDRLDFSLAREPAGGGMRGKSAKLGKLIIEDEGIKMLDLVVSACMAVWWRGYYQ